MSGVIEEARLERNERELAKCKTTKQSAAFRLAAAGGQTPYVVKRAGKTVVQQFRKYTTTMDPKAIDVALYEWSIYDGPGDIAHFNLHGFRATYPHPALYYELLLCPWLERQKQNNWYLPSVYVYTDGLTSHDVRDQILRIAVEWRQRVNLKFGEQKKVRELGEASEIAARYGMKLVPTDES